MFTHDTEWKIYISHQTNALQLFTGQYFCILFTEKGVVEIRKTIESYYGD